jgi:hypothetical protein
VTAVAPAWAPGGHRGTDREGEQGKVGAKGRVAHHRLELVGEDEHHAEGAQDRGWDTPLT